MFRCAVLPTSGVKTAKYPDFFGTSEEAADKSKKGFLQGLKPIGFGGIAPGLKSRPPKEKFPPQAGMQCLPENHS